MFKYILKRLLYMIPVMLVISLILFFIVTSMPGDPVMAYINPDTPMDKMPDLDALREQLGLVGPIHIRYIKWLFRLLQGDLGYSTAYRKAIVDLMPYYMKNTLLLNITAFILSFVFSIIVGIKSAVKRYSFFDNFFTVFSLFGISMPSFFISMIVIFLFVIIIPIFPFSGMVDPRATHTTFISYALDVIHHMTLPTLVICMSSVATLVRYIRNSMLEVLKQDYIRTARSKGLKDKVVIYRHAFRNVLIPIVTLIGIQIPGLFSGSLLVESVFGWPGIGKLMSEAYSQRDQQVILMSTLLFSILTLFSNLLVDIGYALVDPRVRVGGGSNG